MYRDDIAAVFGIETIAKWILLKGVQDMIVQLLFKIREGKI